MGPNKIIVVADIHNALLAANESSAQTAAMVAMLQPKPEPKELRAFRDGFKAALITVALTFGLGPQSLMIGEGLRIEE